MATPTLAPSARPDPAEALMPLRAEILSRFLGWMSVAITVTTIAFIPRLVRLHRFRELVIDSALAIAIGLVASIRLAFPLRARITVGLLTIAATAELWALGLASTTVMAGFAVPFIAVLFLGLPAAGITQAYWLMVVAVFGILDGAGIHLAAPGPGVSPLPMSSWPHMLLAQAVVWVPLIYLAHALVSSLERELLAKRQALADLEAAQATLAASERLKTLGLIAGGVAHDLSNTLMVIAGEVEICGGIPDDARETILEATGSASQLARQLLVSAGRPLAQPRDVAVSQALRPCLKSLDRLLPASVKLVVVEHDSDLVVRADPVLLQQAVLNLAMNANDAMVSGGTLEVSSAREERGGAAWAVIAVRDTGHGMDAATLARATEPFFTTKPLGKGTGLGLWNVCKAIQDQGGSVTIDSSPGSGTTVRLSLPLVIGRLVTIPQPTAKVSGAGQTVLVVEDDLRVRALAYSTLMSAGYHVLETGLVGGAEALLAGGAHLHGLVTDLTLPDGSGLSLARSLRAAFPDLGVLVISGDAASDADREALRANEFQLLVKPFRLQRLATDLGVVIAQRRTSTLPALVAR